MNERDKDEKLRSWARSRGDRPVRAELGRRVLSIPTDEATSPRRRRWLWFLPGRTPTAGARDEQRLAGSTAPITTTSIGGISTMFSPAKLVTATAAAALTGALLLVGPFTTSQVDDPATPIDLSDLPAITLVSGQATSLDEGLSMGTVETHDWGFSVTDMLVPMAFTLDDERLSGSAWYRLNAHRAPETYTYGPVSGSVYLESEGGSWVGTGRGYQEPAATGGTPAAGWHVQLVLEGQGSYEGLTAIMALDQADEYSPFEVSGAIMPLDLAPIPGPAPTTFE